MKIRFRPALSALLAFLLAVGFVAHPGENSGTQAVASAPTGFAAVSDVAGCEQYVTTGDTAKLDIQKISADCVLTFTGSTDWKSPHGISTLQFIVVGGGGGGSADGGDGGGGGETRYSSGFSASLEVEELVRIAVGAGGDPGIHGVAGQGGSDSSVDFSNDGVDVRADGGAAGGGWQNTTTATGGSGGLGGTGYQGGNGGDGPTDSGSQAGSAGANGTSVAFSIRGRDEYFGGGGGGGSAGSKSGTTPTTFDGASGGRGGGGAGAYGKNPDVTVTYTYDVYASGVQPTETLTARCVGNTGGIGATTGFPGLENFGGGGGGGSAYGDNPSCSSGSGDDGERTSGGAGGSGVVIIRYSLPATAVSFDSQPSNQSVNEGSTATFSVSTSGGDTLSYQWQSSTDGVTFSDVAGATSSSYTTSATTRSSDDGKYFRLRVRNANSDGNYLESYSDTATLSVAAVPAQVTNLQATPDAGAVDLTWDAPSANGASITSYSIEYATNSSFTSSSSASSATNSATISSLDNGTRYYFRVSATNNVGTGTASSTVSAVPMPTADSYLTFDGSDDYGSVSGQIITDKDNYTVEAWVYDEATATGDHGILRVGNATSKRLFIKTTKSSSSNKIVVGLNTTGTSTVESAHSLPQEEWVHVALVRDGSTWTLYMNGVSIGTGTATATDFDTGGLLVGSANSGGELWKGRIDQVKIWEGTMSQAQIRTSMNTYSDSGITGPSLVAHYDFNVPSASSLADVEGSYGLTLSGSVATSDFSDVAQTTVDDGDQVVTFPRSYLTSYGGWSVPSAASTSEYLIVGGGASGGRGRCSYLWGQGGGAGGVASGTFTSLSGYQAVTVGLGGNRGASRCSSSSDAGQGSDGFSSTFNSVEATGGEAGTWNSATGGSSGLPTSDSTTVANTGGAGGGGTYRCGISNNYCGAGGGAGAGGDGDVLNAGVGISSSISGSAVIYAAGGAGRNNNGHGTSNGGGSASNPSGSTPGSGGSDAAGTSVLADDYTWGSGASGVVILRYELFATPSISSQPASTTVQAGSNASFSVTASPGGVTYQWQVWPDGGSAWADVDGETGSLLTLTSAASSLDGNQYRVVITNSDEDSGESVSVASNSAFLTVEDGTTVVGAVCDGSYTKNSLTVTAGHGEVFYIDTGQGQEIDAGYIAYVVESDNARSDLWVEVTDFTGGTVSLANSDASTQPLGAVAGGGSDTAFFMIKATEATTTAQSHVVNVYDQKPTIGSPQPIYTCGYSFVEVAETIKAAANKVDSITSTSVSSLGSTMTITVQGDTGTIGQGNDIDGRMIWVTPAARSDWPTDALRLESTSISFYSDQNRRNLLTSHSDTLRVNSSTTPALDTSRRQYYTATYTFRVIGSAAAAAPIIPIAMISSGTQVKHTDVGSLPTGGSATVDVTEPDIDLAVTKTVDSATSVNSDGTTTLSYEITLTNSGSNALVIDEVVDTPDSSVTLVSGSATFAGSSISDPEVTGSSSLAFSGPVTVPANSTRVYAYDMTFETCSVGSTYSIDNLATAKTGTVIIGSGSATQSNVNIAGNCGEEDAVVTVTDELVDPVPATGAASSVLETTATIAGTVDPNSQSGLAVRFIYSTDSNLSSPTPVTLSDTTFVADPYGVSTGLTGLSGGTQYYYAVQVEDPDDNTAWISGVTRSFTTDPKAVPVTVQNKDASSISTTSAVLNGLVDANGVSGGAKVKFEWTTDSSGGSCTTRGAPTLTDFLQSEDGSGGTEDAILTGFSAVPMSYSLTGLTANSDYCYRIIAYDSTGYTSATTAVGWVAFTSTAKTAQTLSWSTTSDPLPAGGTTTVTATGGGSGQSVTYASADEDICTVNSTTGAVTAVASSGTCSITASQAGTSSYYAATPITTSFAILPPVVTPAALVNGAFQTSGYSQTLRATGGNGTYSSWTVSSGSLPGGLTLNSSTGVISGTPTAAGVFTFSVTVTSNSVTSAAQSFTITVTKKTVTVTASSPSVIYGAAAPTISPSYTGFVGSDVTTVSSGSNTAPTCTSTYTVGQNAGTTATTSCSGGSHENYTYTYVTGSVTVTKFPVTITALDAAKQNVDDGTTTTVYADPTLRWVATSPLPAGETISDVVPAGVSISRASSGTTPGDILNTSLPAGETAGTFTITPSGTAGSNYEVTYETGTFTIQTPLQVPSLAVSDKTMTYGDSNTASTFIGGAATNRSGASVTGTYAYTYVDSEGDAVTLDDLSTLNAGTYTVQVAFMADDGDTYYKTNPVIETMVLTVEKKTVTVTAADKKKLVGALDPSLTWSGSGYNGSDSDSTLGPVTISRGSGETAGSYTITTTGGDTPNYAVTHVAGTFYIYEPVITVTKSRGVLTSRTVQADCRGAKVGAGATFSLITNGTSTSIGTTTVASDGTCPMSSTLDSTVQQGAHTLKIESTDPLNAAMSKTETIILLASQIQVINNNPGGGSSETRSNRGRTPVVPVGPRIAPPGLGGVPTPGVVPRPTPALQDQTEETPGAPGTTQGPARVTPRLPGSGETELDGPTGLAGGATVDFGDGVRDAADRPAQSAGGASDTEIRGRRTINELAGERLGGFQPGVSTRIEVLGARSGARFVATEEMLLDSVIAVQAIQNSVPTQAADFFALDDVRPSDTPPEPEPVWSDDEREAIGEFFEASGLDRPVSLADLDTENFTRWVQVTGSASTYVPGSVVYLTLTSEPLVLSSAVVGDDGRAVLTGSLPLEWLQLGEHRVRLVGIRALDGVSVDSEGQVQLSDELLEEIQRFDLGTQSTIAVIGSNSEGASHVALRVVPLVPIAPWWTLWFILGGFLLVGASRFGGLLWSRTRRWLGVSVVLLSAVPGVIIGWISTVTLVTWWALGLGLVAAAVSWIIPQRQSAELRGGEARRGT